MHALCIIHTANYSYTIQCTQFFREHQKFVYIEQIVLNNGMQHTDYTPSATLFPSITSVCVCVIDNTVFQLCIVCVNHLCRPIATGYYQPREKVAKGGLFASINKLITGIFMYKCLNGLLPRTFSSLFYSVHDTHKHHTRSHNNLFLPFTHTSYSIHTLRHYNNII